MVDPVKRAVDQGIPVVIIDSGLADPDLIVKYVSTDNYNGGRLAAEHLLKVLREQGKPAPRLVLFRYQPGSESTEQREKGFEDYVEKVIAEQKKAGQPTITWLSRDKYAGATVDSGDARGGAAHLPAAERGRGRHLRPQRVVRRPACSTPLRSLGLQQKVRLMGFDSSEPLLQALEEDNVVGLIVQDPYRMGYLGVWTLVRHLEGDDVTADGKKALSTGEYVVTKENLDQQATRELFNADLQQRRTIRTPAYPRSRADGPMKIADSPASPPPRPRPACASPAAVRPGAGPVVRPGVVRPAAGVEGSARLFPDACRTFRCSSTRARSRPWWRWGCC